MCAAFEGYGEAFIGASLKFGAVIGKRFYELTQLC